MTGTTTDGYASAEAAREAANLHELIHRASERVDELMRGAPADEDTAAFALFAADVIDGEGVWQHEGVSEHRLELVFRAIARAKA